jgi:hypothetical protein
MAGTYPSHCARPPAWRRFAWLAGLVLATAPAAGCVTLDVFCPPEKPPVGLPCQLATTWEPGLRTALDPYHGGAPYHALAGRLFLFLFDAENTPHLITGDGEIRVELFDDRPLAAGGIPASLEQWVFPSNVTKLLCRKDAVGWGYTIVLPWIKSYSPDITQVHVRVCYQAPGGAPMYIESSPIKLAQSNLVLPQGIAQPHGWQQQPPPSSIPTPAALRLERKPLTATNPNPPAPAVVPVPSPATAAPVQAAPQAAVLARVPPPAAAPAAEDSREWQPIVLTPRRLPPSTAPAPAQGVNQPGGPPANLSFEAGSQAPALPITQTSGRMPEDTAGAASQPGWVGTAK